MFSLLRKESLWIPVILLVILVGCWAELDLYAPSFPQMMHHFQTTEQVMQWTLSLNFLGFFFASLLCGPLADAFGRRIVIFLGSIIFVLGSYICLMAPNMFWMILGRFIQGIGVSAPVTVCMAVVADIYQGDRQIRLLSRMNSVTTIAMALAPIVGVYLTDSLGWQSNFVAILGLALLGTLLVALFVPETHEVKLRNKFSARGLVSGYLRLLKGKDFMFNVLGLCLSITPYFILIGILPLLFMEELGISLNSYAFYQGSIVGMFSILSLFIPWIMARFNVNKIMISSVFLSLGSLCLAYICSLFIADNANLITLLMLFNVIGMVVPPTVMFSGAMDMYPDLRACSSSLIQSLRMLCMSLGTAIAGACYDGTFKPVALVMLAFMVLSVPFSLSVIRKRKLLGSEANETIVVAMH